MRGSGKREKERKGEGGGGILRRSEILMGSGIFRRLGKRKGKMEEKGKDEEVKERGKSKGDGDKMSIFDDIIHERSLCQACNYFY